MLPRDPGGWASRGLMLLCLGAADDHLCGMLERCKDPFTALALLARGA